MKILEGTNFKYWLGAFVLPLWCLCQFCNQRRSLLAQLWSPCCPIRFFRLRGRYLSTHNRLLPSLSGVEWDTGDALLDWSKLKLFLTSEREAPSVPDLEAEPGLDFRSKGLLLLGLGPCGVAFLDGGVGFPLETGVLVLEDLFCNTEYRQTAC